MGRLPPRLQPNLGRPSACRSHTAHNKRHRPQRGGPCQKREMNGPALRTDGESTFNALLRTGQESRPPIVFQGNASGGIPRSALFSGRSVRDSDVPVVMPVPERGGASSASSGSVAGEQPGWRRTEHCGVRTTILSTFWPCWPVAQGIVCLRGDGEALPHPRGKGRRVLGMARR